jgi:hypothetical protein
MPQNEFSVEQLEQLRAIIREELKQAVQDPVILDTVFNSWSKKASDTVAQWVGKRVLMILFAALLSSSIVWAVLTGRIK